MDALDSFIEEVLNDDVRREGLLSDMLAHLESQPLPSEEQLRTGFTDSTQRHGVYYDYDKQEVTIAYRVVDNMYPDRTMSFANFRVILEGLIVCRRNKKWAINN